MHLMNSSASLFLMSLALLRAVQAIRYHPADKSMSGLTLLASPDVGPRHSLQPLEETLEYKRMNEKTERCLDKWLESG